MHTGVLEMSTNELTPYEIAARTVVGDLRSHSLWATGVRLDWIAGLDVQSVSNYIKHRNVYRKCQQPMSYE